MCAARNLQDALRAVHGRAARLRIGATGVLARNHGCDAGGTVHVFAEQPDQRHHRFVERGARHHGDVLAARLMPRRVRDDLFQLPLGARHQHLHLCRSEMVSHRSALLP
jgi:hypothetical protein